IPPLFVSVSYARAGLAVKAEEPQRVGGKAIIRLTMTNTFKQQIQSARAQVFLLDDKGKVVGQAARWVIGGTKDKPGLAPDASLTYNFVVDADKPFKMTKVSFNRLIVEGGTLADPRKDVEIK